jgi:hypothetical protein
MQLPQCGSCAMCEPASQLNQRNTQKNRSAPGHRLLLRPPPLCHTLSHAAVIHTHTYNSVTHTPAWQALTAPGWLGWTALIAATLSDIVTQHYHTEVSRTQRRHTQLCHTQTTLSHTLLCHTQQCHMQTRFEFVQLYPPKV